MSKLLRLPGLIDIHVHLRDPGETYKEDFYSGTSAALAGGITTVFDMPNNLEPIFSSKTLDEKENIAKQKAVCDWGLYFGTNGDNLAEFKKIAKYVVGLKVYLSLTTGKYVINDIDKLKKIYKEWPKEKVMVIHAEGDRVDLAIRLAEQYNNKLHITHVNTKVSLKRIIDAKRNKLNITCDVTPHHLFLVKNGKLSMPDSFYQVKPSLSTKKDQDFLWDNLGKIDCIASDHGPHTTEEKKSVNPPFGLPGLETMLPLLLTAVNQKRLTMADVARLTIANPQKIFGFKQDKETYIEVDSEKEWIIDKQYLKTKCAWSPFAGWQVYGAVKKVYLRGTKVFENGQVLVSPGFGRSVIG